MGLLIQSGVIIDTHVFHLTDSEMVIGMSWPTTLHSTSEPGYFDSEEITWKGVYESHQAPSRGHIVPTERYTDTLGLNN